MEKPQDLTLLNMLLFDHTMDIPEAQPEKKSDLAEGMAKGKAESLLEVLLEVSS